MLNHEPGEVGGGRLMWTEVLAIVTLSGALERGAELCTLKADWLEFHPSSHVY